MRAIRIARIGVARITGFYFIQESKLKSIKILPKKLRPKLHRPGDMCGERLITLIHPSITLIRIPSYSLFPDDSITEHLFIAGDNHLLAPACKCTLVALHYLDTHRL